MIEDKLYSKEKINLDNKTLFKGKDLGLLKEVIKYLKTNNLSADLKGGLVKNFNKGNLRHYQDIDLAIKTNEIKRFSSEYDKYVNVIRDLYQASTNKKNLNGWIVEDFTEQHPMYVGLKIGYRFKIKDSKTKTEIDLSFGEEDKDLFNSDFRGKNIPTPNSNPSLMFFTRKNKKR